MRSRRSQIAAHQLAVSLRYLEVFTKHPNSCHDAGSFLI